MSSAGSSNRSDFISREELLGGLPARRASTLLFAIEARTAHMVARSRRALARYMTERTVEEQERAFLDALSQGRSLPLQPTIQDLERYAPDWASLVPPDAGVRAVLARMIGEKYLMPENRVPGITAALGINDHDVSERYLELHNSPIASIFAAQLPVRERWRWVRAAASARLENLPPFWTAFALTLTETVGAGILALPIAFASAGPIGGLIALAVLGIVNILTIAAMAEAVARNGNVRYGRAYFGRMVEDYLGRAGMLVLAPALLLLNIVILLTYFIGFASTLADATSLRAEFWAAGLVVVLLIFLRRKSLDATVAAALMVGATTILLIIVLSLIALPHVTGANLRHAEIPFRNGLPFDESVLELIFGVVLLAFFGHTSTANCAAVVLEKDPGARSLIRGTAAAIGTALGLYSIWVIAVNGAVPSVSLANESGTALVPLAAQVGASVHIVGAIFVVLAMGMASIHIAIGLSHQVREWLPTARISSSGELPGVKEPTALINVRWAMSGPGGRQVAGFIPTIAIFLLAEWLFLSNRESFAGLLGFLGVITAPIVAGVFSMLMLSASRNKGDCAVVGGLRFLGHPILVGGVCLIFLASIVVHGLFIWDDLLQQVSALLVSLVIVGLVVTVRRTSFAPRVAVELRVGAEAHAAPIVNVVARGESVPTQIEWSNGAHMRAGRNGAWRTALFDLQELPVRELKFWAHRLTPEGRSENLPAKVSLENGLGSQQYDLAASGGQIIVAVSGESQRVAISIPGS